VSARLPEPDLGSGISEVNVVPLADVSLVLLIIILVMSPMIAQSWLHVKTAGEATADELPPAAAAPPELVLLVDLGPKGLQVGDRFFRNPMELSAWLKEELPRRLDRKVFLAPHPDVKHGQVIHLLETIKSAGAESVALVETAEAPAAP
jgi:biopolymer transport protein ExbD